MRKTDIAKIDKQLDAFYTAYRCAIYLDEMLVIKESKQILQEFWQFQEYLLLYGLIINWSELFGIQVKNDHWKEITFENRDYSKMFYEVSGYDYSKWLQYRNYINEIRKSYLVYPDQYHHQSVDIDKEGIEYSLNHTHAWLNEIATYSQEKDLFKALEKWPVSNLNYAHLLRSEINTIMVGDAMSYSSPKSNLI